MTDFKSIKTIAVEVREQLKREFPKCKFSVTIQQYSGGQSLHVSLMSAPFEVFKITPEREYAQLNEYQLRSDYEREQGISNGTHLTEEGWSVLARVSEISNKDNWNHSDSSIDYFDVNYYFHLNVGKWNKPFVKK